MVDDNRFSGLGDQLDDASADPETEDPNPEPESETADETRPADRAGTETPADSPGSSPDDEEESETVTGGKETPAFEFSDTKQDPLYPIEETWQDFDDALDFEVRRALRDDGYVNIEKRELHEATLRVAIDNPELVAEKVRELRRD